MKNKILTLNITLFFIIGLAYFTAPENLLPSKQQIRSIASESTVPTKWGFEFEYTGPFSQVNPELAGAKLREVPESLYRKPLEIVKSIVGGDNEIQVIPWDKDPERNLIQAKWVDGKGRTWLAEPEWVNFPTADGVELVTPPLSSEDDGVISQILTKMAHTGEYTQGWRSGVHFTMEVANLIEQDGKCPKLINFILNTEQYMPEIYGAISPIRYGTIVNRFGVPLAADFPDLFKKLAELPENKQTFANVKELFEQYWDKEFDLWKQIEPGVDEAKKKAFKYRAANYRKLFGLGDTPELHVIEFRTLDFGTETEIMQNSSYLRRFYSFAADTPNNRFLNPWKKARSKQEILAKDFSRLNKTVFDLSDARFAKHISKLGYGDNELTKLHKITGPTEISLSSKEFDKLISDIDFSSPIVIDGKEITVGFELEYQPQESDRIFEFFNDKSPGNYKILDDLTFIEDRVGVEHTGNREIRSLPATILDDMWKQMKTVKSRVKIPKGFHLHLRFPISRYEQIGQENFDGWMSRISDAIVGWRLEHKKTYYSLNTWSQGRMDPYHSYDRATMRVKGKAEDMVDIEIRGFMTSIDQIADMTRIIVAGLKNPDYIQGFHANQSALFTKRAELLTDTLNSFLIRYFGRTLKTEEKTHLINMAGFNRSKAIVGPKMLLPLQGFEHMPYFTRLEQQRFQDATTRYLWWMKSFILDRMDHSNGVPAEDLDLNVAFRYQIKKWAKETNWAQMVKKTLLMKPVTNFDHLYQNPNYYIWLLAKYKISPAFFGEIFRNVFEPIPDERIIDVAANYLTPEEREELIRALSDKRSELKEKLRTVENNSHDACIRSLRNVLESVRLN